MEPSDDLYSQTVQKMLFIILQHKYIYSIDFDQKLPCRVREDFLQQGVMRRFRFGFSSLTI